MLYRECSITFEIILFWTKESNCRLFSMVSSFSHVKKASARFCSFSMTTHLLCDNDYQVRAHGAAIPDSTWSILSSYFPTWFSHIVGNPDCFSMLDFYSGVMTKGPVSVCSLLYEKHFFFLHFTWSVSFGTALKTLKILRFDARFVIWFVHIFLFSCL